MAISNYDSTGGGSCQILGGIVVLYVNTVIGVLVVGDFFYRVAPKCKGKNTSVIGDPTAT